MAAIHKEYQLMINSKIPDHSHWTQFELDLITCIRDEYSVIYLKKSWGGRQRNAGKILHAWNQISKKFGDLTYSQIRNKWKSILQNYFKYKIYNGSETSNEELKYKYSDGILNFLENMDPKLLMMSLKQSTTDHSDSDDDNVRESTESYTLEIKDLLHEEIDLDDEEEGKIKIEAVEMDENTSLNKNISHKNIDKNTTLQNTDKKISPKKQQWSEDELMNATRLTKEMIDELILIKTRKYYLEPVETAKK